MIVEEVYEVMRGKAWKVQDGTVKAMRGNEEGEFELMIINAIE